MFYSDPCPKGYEQVEGDEPGWGSYLGKQLKLTRQECSEACNEKYACMSFEHSDSEMFCNLNAVSKPSSGAYRDYVFCQKTGNTF